MHGHQRGSGGSFEPGESRFAELWFVGLADTGPELLPEEAVTAPEVGGKCALSGGSCTTTAVSTLQASWTLTTRSARRGLGLRRLPWNAKERKAYAS